MKYQAKAFIGLLVLIAVLLIFRQLIQTPEFETIKDFATSNLYLFLLLVVVYRILSGLIPLLPADALTFFAIPIGGVGLAFLADMTGGIIGASTAYAIGRFKGDDILKKVFGKKITKQIESLEVDVTHEMMIIFVMRTAYLGLLSTPVCYWSGLEKLKYKNFLAADILVHLAFRVPVFVIGASVLTTGINPLVIFVASAYTLVMVYLSSKYIRVEKEV